MRTTCIAGDCDRPRTGLGLCVKHYGRFVKHGNTSEPFVRRLLFERIAYSADCWEFTGCRDARGYGRIGRDGKTVLAHRAVYELLVGPIPDGLELDHLCRNPPCCNPDHLDPVTHAENVRRGRAGYAPTDRCKYGHDLNDPANVYRHTRGMKGRKCKPCALRRSRETHKHKKEQEHVS